jgi:restriction endonuclease S subunit
MPNLNNTVLHKLPISIPPLPEQRTIAAVLGLVQRAIEQHEPLGLTQIEEQKWEVRYSFHLLGVLDEQLKTVVPVKTWHHINAKKV